MGWICRKQLDETISGAIRIIAALKLMNATGPKTSRPLHPLSYDGQQGPNLAY